MLAKWVGCQNALCLLRMVFESTSAGWSGCELSAAYLCIISMRATSYATIKKFSKILKPPKNSLNSFFSYHFQQNNGIYYFFWLADLLHFFSREIIKKNVLL
jgi:hypothetical protein